jgi:hypothetical protein
LAVLWATSYTIVHPQLLGRAPEGGGEDLANPVQDHLAVGEGHVDGTLHGGEVIPPLGRFEWRTGQFAIRDGNLVLALHDPQEELQVIGRHLMPETSAAAVEHHHHLIRDGDPHRPGQRGIALNSLWAMRVTPVLGMSTPIRIQSISMTARATRGTR